MINFGMTQDEFKSKYEEKEPLVIKGAFKKGAVSWAAVNEAITRCDAFSPSFRISFPDGNVEKDKYIDSYFHIGELRRVLNKGAVYDYLSEGATLVANSIFDEPVFNQFAKEIALFTGRQTVTAAYIAFGQRNSYREHWDSRDVFAVQLIGRKRWTLYKPTFEYPLYMHQSKYLESKYQCPTVPACEFVLEEGDVLYMPRGWWHNVEPLGEETVHLAIGTFPPYALDYIKWVFRQLPDVVEARRALDGSKEDIDFIRTSLANEIAQRLKDDKNYQMFLEDHYGNQRLETPLAMEKLGNITKQYLPKDTVIKFNVLKGDMSTEYIVTALGRVRLSEEFGKLRCFLINHPITTLGDVYQNVQGLDDKQIQTSIRELARIGVLELS